MSQIAIPYVFMRGGTSRGPYFRRDDLPSDLSQLARVLIAVIGSGHRLNIDGIGGGDAVTTKVAMLSRSDDPWADIDYFFAQVSVEDQSVDFKPTCGNILSGVAAAALELGLLDAELIDRGVVKIRAVNTGARVIAEFATCGNEVIYDGDYSIAGVPGSASAVGLKFMDTVGKATGAMLPTGRAVEQVNGIDVTCIDVAMPMVIARASSFGLSGYETVAELDDNRPFFEAFEAIRIEAGQRMGIENVSQSVTPKFALLAPAINGGDIAARYFMPWKTHPSMAVTGAQCIASCVLLDGSVASGMMTPPTAGEVSLSIEHPSGAIEVLVEFEREPAYAIVSAGLVRTARKLADGRVYIPNTLAW